MNNESEEGYENQVEIHRNRAANRNCSIDGGIDRGDYYLMFGPGAAVSGALRLMNNERMKNERMKKEAGALGLPALLCVNKPAKMR